MISPKIGHRYQLADGSVQHCQDVDLVQHGGRFGIPDEHGVIWDPKWVPFTDVLCKTEAAYVGPGGTAPRRRQID